MVLYWWKGNRFENGLYCVVETKEANILSFLHFIFFFQFFGEFQCCGTNLFSRKSLLRMWLDIKLIWCQKNLKFEHKFEFLLNLECLKNILLLAVFNCMVSIETSSPHEVLVCSSAVHQHKLLPFTHLAHFFWSTLCSLCVFSLGV